ncbi:hypothetical protein [Streptomyces sp. NBC_00019]|uniref:hypothetical protein n=1 Tax=Streptomyces sp. NBC_00019 TaxID=2975623 RepID=UPI003245E7DE
MSDVREVVMPRQVRGAQVLLFVLAVGGLVSMLALSDGLTAYGQGEMLAPWALVWVCALLALTYDGGARGGVRMTTIVVMVFMVLPTVMKMGEAVGAGLFLDAALRILLGVPVVVLLFLPESTAWFDRER